MLTKAISFVAFLFPCVANLPLAFADTIVEFPQESVGVLYCAPSDKVFFGADAHLAGHMIEWEFLATASGQVRLPEGKWIRLVLRKAPTDSKSVQDTSWIRKVPSHAIHSLHANASMNDLEFSEFANWTGLLELGLVNCQVSSAIAPQLAKLTQLRSLRFAVSPGIDDAILSTVAALPDLQEFNLRRVKVTDSGMTLLSRSRSLNYVMISEMAITDEGVASLAKLPLLRALNVYSAEPDDEFSSYHDSAQTKVTDLGLEHLGQCSQLMSLNIHGAKVSTSGLQKLFTRCPDLRYLAISKSTVELGALEVASRLKNLQTIRITGKMLDDRIASQISKLPNLRQIEGILQIGNEGVEKLASLPHLESLQFFGNADDSCMQALSNLSKLKELSIDGSRITDDGLAKLHGFPQLEKVQLGGPGFTSRCLNTAATWPQLKSLALSYLSPRKDGKAEWAELSTLPATLQQLEFQSCPNTNDDLLQAIGSLAHLKSLSIQSKSVTEMTDTGAGHLAQASNLTSLLLQPTILTDKGLLSLRGIESLKNLSVTCLASPVGLSSLGHLPRLNSLTFGSPNLSPENIASFKAQYPHVQQLQFQECDFSRAKADGTQDSILRRGSLRSRTELNALEGKAPPAFHATAWTPANGEVKLEDLRGKVVLLDFWGTWCTACLSKLPRIRELEGKYRDQGLVVVTIHSTEESENAAAYLSKHPIPWTNGCDVDNHTATAFAVTRWPSLYLIDRQGMVRFANPLDDHLEDAIRLLLEEAK